MENTALRRSCGSTDGGIDPCRVASVRRDADGRHFLCGASTAAHQVEGNNSRNDWWPFEQSGQLPYRSGEACRHFELYESDFDLAQSLGHNAHRFSLEWSRIEPEEGNWNRAALDHYVRVIDALLCRGLEPVVTLHHFTNPQWFARSGGWTAARSIDRFRRYVDFVAPALVRLVRYFITINEPTVYVKRAYVAGDWPPCSPRSFLKAARALRNQCRAHVEAFECLHEHRTDAMVGFAHSAPHIVPANPGRLGDRLATFNRHLVLNRLPFLLLGKRPADVLDFIGVNYYTRQVVAWRSRGAANPFGVEVKTPTGGEVRSFNSLGWEVYPRGLLCILREFSAYGLPLIITENGIATSDESVRDSFVASHLEALDQARAEGQPVHGYFYWSLMDNFEWTEGYNARFGLTAVDFETQKRMLRPAALRLAAYCKAQLRRDFQK